MCGSRTPKRLRFGPFRIITRAAIGSLPHPCHEHAKSIPSSANSRSRRRSSAVNAHGHFVWYELSTTDMESAKAFYTSVMGWGMWDASAPGRPCIVLTAGDRVVCGLVELADDARRSGAGPCWVG